MPSQSAALPTAIEAAALAALVGTPDAPPLIDVRRRTDFEADGWRIAGAGWRDHREAASWGPALPPGPPPVLYCVHGHNVSQAAVAQLHALGIAARYLEGGIEAYRAAGGAVIAKGGALPAAEAGPTRWVTRARPKIDRLACPWFLRRFVDPAAEILYVDAEWVLPTAEEFGAVPFDVPDVDYSHVGERCSFDAFLARFRVSDPALLRVAEVVRAADTGRAGEVPEAAGLLALSLGLAAAIADDQALLAAGMTLYDGLYAWARRASGERHDWRPETLPRGVAA